MKVAKNLMLKTTMVWLAASLGNPAMAQLSGDTALNKSNVSSSPQQIAFLQTMGTVNLQRQKTDAMNLYQAMQFSLAGEAFKKVCLLEPNDGSNHYWLAESLYEQSSFAAASAEYSRAVALDPQMEKAHVRLAESILGTRNFPQARTAAVNALSAVHDERLKGRLWSVLRVASKGLPQTPNTAPHTANHCENRSTK